MRRARGRPGQRIGLAIVKHAVSHHESRLNIEVPWGRHAL
ncbi:hypothetical protein ACNKHO_02160 [Shigella flexneri]